jgi:hypothetical protein
VDLPTFDAQFLARDEVPAEGDRAAAGLLDSEPDLGLVVKGQRAVVDDLGGVARRG